MAHLSKPYGIMLCCLVVQIYYIHSDSHSVESITKVQYVTPFITPKGDQLIKVTPENKNSIAFAAKTASARGRLSVLKTNAAVNHPEGGELFPTNGGLASSLSGVVSAMKTAGAFTSSISSQGKTAQAELSYFVPLYRKIQFMVLNDLYVYLTGIYATFNLTHVPPVDAKLKQYVPDMDAYLSGEQTSALNKKSLIVSHLLNVIQGQMYFICTHILPMAPSIYGLKMGNMMLSHDFTVDPTFLVRDLSKKFFDDDLKTAEQKQVHASLESAQSLYLQTLGRVLSFFGEYTGYLSQPDETSALPGSNAFYPLASHIASFMQKDSFNTGVKALKANPAKTPQAAKSKVQQLRNLRASTKQINPPLFYYNSDTLRAIKMIPRVASELPAGSQSVGLPDQLVKYAQEGTPATGASGLLFQPSFPKAYFKTVDGEQKLFMNVPTRNGPFGQEILAQPDWLNTRDGVIKILRACLGDYTQLVGLGILDPCTENIICKALAGVNCPAATVSQCDIALAKVNQIEQEYIQNLKSGKPSTQPVTPPGYQNGLPPGYATGGNNVPA